MRLRSLTNGINSLIFTADEISAKELFDENVIVDISRVGSTETKALIMGLLVMKLQEYRMANHNGANEDLKHVTVLEEAHTLLKRTATEQSGESANLLGKSVEMLTNSIAEMRTYGEGFIIADQSPGLLDMAVIRNTNTKIILRLPEYSDRELVGKAAGLNDDQIDELAKLKRGVAAVYQNDWIEAVLCSVDHFKCPTRSDGQCKDTYSPNNLKGDLISRFIAKDLYRLIDPVDRERIITADISVKAKCRLFEYLSADKSKRDELAAGIAFDLFDCGSVISKMKPELTVEHKKNCLFKHLKAELSPLADNYINLILCLVTYWIAKEAPTVPEASLLADISLKEAESWRGIQ